MYSLNNKKNNLCFDTQGYTSSLFKSSTEGKCALKLCRGHSIVRLQIMAKFAAEKKL